MDAQDLIFRASDDLQAKTALLSDQIWDAAEVAFTEEKSCGYLMEYLASEGFEIVSGIAGIPTAFTATLAAVVPISDCWQSMMPSAAFPRRPALPNKNPFPQAATGMAADIICWAQAAPMQAF